MYALDTYLVSGDEVPDEEQHAHDDMLGDGCDVGASDFKDLQSLTGGSVEVDVIRPDTGSKAELQVFGL